MPAINDHQLTVNIAKLLGDIKYSDKMTYTEKRIAEMLTEQEYLTRTWVGAALGHAYHLTARCDG